MDDAMSAIRRAITDEEAGEMTLAPTEPRTSGEEARGETNTRGRIAVAQSNCRNRLCVQHVDGNCEEARADTRGRGSRNASPHAEVMAGRKLAPRGRANGAGRDRTGYSRTLITIPVELNRVMLPPHPISLAATDRARASAAESCSDSSTRWPSRL
jgi:hypothetical protein